MADYKLAIKLQFDNKELTAGLQANQVQFRQFGTAAASAGAQATAATAAVTSAAERTTIGLAGAAGASDAVVVKMSQATSSARQWGAAASTMGQVSQVSYSGAAVAATKMTAAIDDSAKAADRAATGAYTSAARGVRSISEQLGQAESALKAYISVQAAIGVVRWVTEQASDLKQLEGRLRTVTDSTADFAFTFAGALALSNRSGTAVGETIGAFARLNPTIKEMGGSSAVTMRMLGGLNSSLKLSGATTQEANAVMLQFAQAMGSGRVGGDEFRSMMESAQPLMRAVAQELGVSTGELRQMAEEGRLTSSVFANAMLPAIDKLISGAEKIAPTMGQAFQALKNNALVNFGREFESTATTMGEAISWTADHTLEMAAAAHALVDTLSLVVEKAVIVAGAAGLGALVLTLGSATAATGGLVAGLSAVNAVTVALVTSAAIAKLERLSVAGKAGLLGLVFWGSYEITDFLTNLGNVRAGIVDMLTPVFEAYDRIAGDSKRKSTLAIDDAKAKLKELQGLKASGTTAQFKDTEVLGMSSKKLVPIDDLIAEATANTQRLEKSYETMFAAPAKAQKSAAAVTRLSSAGEYETLTKDLKYREKIISEYDAKLLNLQQSYADKYAVTGNADRPALQQRQQKELTAMLAERKAALEGASDFKAGKEQAERASARMLAVYEGNRADSLRIFQQAGKDIESERQRGLITDEEFFTRRRDLGLKQNTDQQALVESELAIARKYAAGPKVREAAERQYTSELKKLQGERLSLQRDYDRAIEEEKTKHQNAINKIVASNNSIADKEIEAQRKAVDSLIAGNEQLRNEIAVIGLSETARANRLQVLEREAIAELELRLIGAQNDEYRTSEVALLEREIALRTQRMGLLGDKRIAEDAKAASEQWKKTGVEIEKNLTDSLMRGFENGKSLAENFRDTVINMFKTMVLRPVVSAIVNPIAQGITGAMGLNAGSSSGLMGGLSNLSTANSIYGAVTGGYASALGSGVSAVFGTTAGNAAIGTAVTGSASSAAAAATAAAEAAGATSAAASSAAAIGSTIAAAVPYVAAAVAVASLWDNAFGMGEKQTTASGLRGTLSSAGANVNNFNTWSQKGGWFRDDASGEDVTAVSSQMQQFLDAAVGQTTAATQAYATAIGLSADTVNSYTQAINLNLDGLDEAGKQEAISKALGGFADGMAGVYGGVFRLRKEGEGASTTLARLSTSLATTNGWFAKVDQTLLAVSVSGADAASQLADNFGGLDKLSSSLQSYYDNYFSDAERAATSTAQISKALADVNVAMPKSKEEFRAIASSLDLNTVAGRKAYATLLTLAPEFATVAEQTSKAASETANQLLKTFSGRGRLLPLLSQTVAGVDDLNGALAASVSQALDMGNAAGWISTRLGDSSSDLLFFSDQVGALNQPMSSSQLAAAALTEQISDLQLMASGAEIDFAALNAALADVDTETFMNVMEGVLNKVAALFEDVLGDISSERIAVRDAALQILGPQVLTKDQIQRGIDGVNAGALPSNSGLIAAQASLAAVDKLVADNEAAIAATRKTQPGTGTLDTSAAALSAATAKVANAQTLVDQFRAYGNESFNYFMDQAYAGNDLRGTVPNPSGERNAQQVVFDLLDAKAALQQPTADYQAQLKAYNTAQAAFEATLVPLQAYAATLASVNLPAALSAVQDAQSTYVEGLQDYAIDAGKATQKLSKLREETVKYYDQQKALADLMAKSAAGLRSTVADYKYSQLDPADQLNNLQSEYAKAYSMALSTNGEDLAGYGDKLNGLLNPLLEKAKEVYTSDAAYNAFAATTIARAEAIAARLDTLTPTDYAADSLDMLASIDATLAVLDESSKSAEKIISEAINAGSDKTAAGLRALIAAVTGQSVPAFAAGGDFSGGWRVVGEDGPELEATGPSRIFNASQTRAILSGGAGGGGSTGNTARLEALVQALTLEVSNQRFELRAIAVNTAGTERILKRVTPDGESLQTTAVAA